MFGRGPDKQKLIEQSVEVVARLVRTAMENGGGVTFTLENSYPGVSLRGGGRYWPPTITTLEIINPGPKPTAEDDIDGWLARANEPWVEFLGHDDLEECGWEGRDEHGRFYGVS